MKKTAIGFVCGFFAFMALAAVFYVGTFTSTSVLTFPFNGNYASPFIWEQIFLGDTNNISYARSYAESTNVVDKSINVITREGINMNPVSGPLISGLPWEGFQMESHFNQAGSIVQEFHMIIGNTNGSETRPFSFQHFETNGFINGSFAANHLGFGSQTNANQGITIDSLYTSPSQPTYQVSLNGNSFLVWGDLVGGNWIKASDSSGNNRNIFSWSAACGGSGCLFLCPDNDFASLQVSTDLLMLNQHPIGRANNTGFSPDRIFANVTMSSAGGLIAGGTTDPGNGVLQATNQLYVSGTTNFIKFGATNTAPASVSAPVKWVTVQINGEGANYRMPLYQ